jgi:glycosyltransferase involved in cell wall biosynthesis
MPPLRLAVDARAAIEDVRGIGRYVRAVLQRLVVRDDVALTLLAYGPLAALRFRAQYAGALGCDRFEVRSRVPPGVQVAWHPANGTFFDAPHAANVATIHDAAPFRYPCADRARREREQQPFLRSAATASRVIAVSAFGASEIAAGLRYDPARIAIVRHGVDCFFSPGDTGALAPGLQAQRYLLFVGPWNEERTNFATIRAAYARAWPQGDGPRLAVAGSGAPSDAGIVSIEARGDAMMRALYRGAIALVVPSRYEGFGMTVLEAMACGTPVLAADAAPLPEVGGEAARYVAAEDVAAWSEALRAVASDAGVRDRLRVAGLQRAAVFDWETSTLRHLACFREAVEKA